MTILVAGLGHPILGDSVHGSTTCNRAWREERGLEQGRLCLHLARLKLEATAVSPAFDVACQLPRDFRRLLHKNAASVLAASTEALSRDALQQNFDDPDMAGREEK